MPRVKWIADVLGVTARDSQSWYSVRCTRIIHVGCVQHANRHEGVPAQAELSVAQTAIQLVTASRAQRTKAQGLAAHTLRIHE